MLDFLIILCILAKEQNKKYRHCNAVILDLFLDMTTS